MELSEIRTKIDAVDDELLRLFLERMDLAEEVAAYKNEHHLPILHRLLWKTSLQHTCHVDILCLCKYADRSILFPVVIIIFFLISEKVFIQCCLCCLKIRIV